MWSIIVVKNKCRTISNKFLIMKFWSKKWSNMKNFGLKGDFIIILPYENCICSNLRKKKEQIKELFYKLLQVKMD